MPGLKHRLAELPDGTVGEIVEERVERAGEHVQERVVVRDMETGEEVDIAVERLARVGE